MSFYRTYRPQSIEEIDNLAVRAALSRLLTKPKKDLPHAFFLSGPRGAGKTTAARVIAKLFNCEKPTELGSCGTCEQCITIAQGKNLDVLEIDAASNRGIDEIRALRDAIALAPVSAGFRVYIIDEVHMLTTEAFNALLKTLEEPPAHAVFILATTDPQKVPVTIQSRTTPVLFSKATTEEIRSALARIVEKEKLRIDEAALALIADTVDGSFRDAVKNLEQLSFEGGEITAATVQSVLAITGQQYISSFLKSVGSRNAKEAIDVVEQLVSQGKDIKSFVVECLQVLEKQMISEAGSPTDAHRTDVSVLVRKLSQAYAEMKSAAISQLPLELAVVEYCFPDPDGVVYPVSRPSAGGAGGSAGQGIATRASGASPSGTVHPAAPSAEQVSQGSLTVSKLSDHWPDIIAALKEYNHSIAGVMRSTRPKSVSGGIVTIEAFFAFHKDKLSEPKTKDVLVDVVKKLFGEKVKIEIVLGTK